MNPDGWKRQDLPVSDELLLDAIENMRRTACYGNLSPAIVLEVSEAGERSVSMLALALELARARGLGLGLEEE